MIFLEGRHDPRNFRNESTRPGKIFEPSVPGAKSPRFQTQMTTPNSTCINLSRKFEDNSLSLIKSKILFSSK